MLIFCSSGMQQRPEAHHALIYSSIFILNVISQWGTGSKFHTVVSTDRCMQNQSSFHFLELVSFLISLVCCCVFCWRLRQQKGSENLHKMSFSFCRHCDIMTKLTMVARRAEVKITQKPCNHPKHSSMSFKKMHLLFLNYYQNVYNTNAVTMEWMRICP